ncbi:MAG: hypothetical protein JO023_17155 [Chloroflexi bacterium]|nr:hypothetical protein [Chloroflexota bacterium]
MQIMQRSTWTGVTIVVLAGVLGLAVLPLVFGGLPDRNQAVLWLALAVIACVALLLPARGLANALAAALTRVPERRGSESAWSHHTATDLARLVVAAGFLLFLQAILRHPVVAVFGVTAEPFVIEAAIAVFALLVLLVLLGAMYRAARPILEGLAWSALDSLFATSRSEQAAEAAHSIGPVVTSTLVAPEPAGATVTRVAPAEEAVDKTLPRSAGVHG